MHKTFAVLVALALAGATGLAITLSGSWSMDIEFLPTPALGEMTLELTYTPVVGWDITSLSVFDGIGLAGQEFSVLGVFGPFTIEGSMEFATGDITLKSLSYVIPDSWSGLGYDLLIQDGIWEIPGPSYAHSSLLTTFDFGGIALGLEIEHQANYKSTLDAADMVAEYLFYLDFPTYLIGADSWTLQPHPILKPWVVQAAGAPYPSYFLTYEHIKLVTTVVTFQGVDLGGAPVTHVLTGAFEVYYFDAGTNTVILTLGADTYLWYYIAEYGAANGWDLAEEITYDIVIGDVLASFLFPSMMSYTFTAGLDPLALEVVFVDYCSGIQFSHAKVSLTGLSLCCGITFDAELGFSKLHGFDHITFSVKNFAAISYGISFDAVVTFTTTSKSVEIVPRWQGIEGCLAVYGDVRFVENVWDGIEIYGFKVRCELAECNYLELLTAFNVAEIEETLDEDIFEGPEFQYLRLGFCGPGCCGEQYTLELTAYFQPTGSLFGIRRFAVEAGIPIMANLTAHLDLEVTVGGPAALAVGWAFTF